MFALVLSYIIPQLLAVRLRKPKQIAWLIATCTPVLTLWNDLISFRLLMLEWILVTIQTDILQAKMRVLYPAVGTYNVYINTFYDRNNNKYVQFIGEHHLQEFDYKFTELPPGGYVPFQNSVSEWTNTWQYRAIVPTAYLSFEDDIRGLLNRYRPAGKQFIIQFQDI